MIYKDHGWLLWYVWFLTHIPIKSLWMLKIDVPEWAFQHTEEDYENINTPVL